MRTNASRFQLFPEGTYIFTVKETPQEDPTDTGKMRYFFKFDVSGQEKSYEEKIPVWLIAPLLRALGCKEVATDEFDWEYEDVVGVSVRATIYHEVVKTDKGDRTYARMTDIQSTKEKDKEEEEESSIPF